MAKLLGFSTVGKVKAPYSLVGNDVVIQDLLNEFYCRKGERLMRPNFGCTIWDLIMDPNVNADQEVREEISRILKKDPRVEELEVAVTSFEHGIRAQVKINILPYNVEEFLYLDYVREIEEGTL
jgi:phage baseplate assembly protein W